MDFKPVTGRDMKLLHMIDLLALPELNPRAGLSLGQDQAAEGWRSDVLRTGGPIFAIANASRLGSE